MAMRTTYWLMRASVFAAFGLLALTSVSSAQTMPGARSLGLGGAYAAVGDDPAALAVNPALLARMTGTQAQMGYSKLWWGISGGGIGLGFAGVTQDLGSSIGGVGLDLQVLSTPTLSELSTWLGYARAIIPGTLDFGVDARIIRAEYLQSGFDDEARADPFFATNGFTKTAISADAAVFAKLTDAWSATLVAANLTSPDMALVADPTRAYPLTMRLATAYAFEGGIQPTMQLEYSTKPINGRTLNLAIGVETWLLPKELAARVGTSLDHADVGLSYRVNGSFDWQFDYAFTLPINQLAHAGTSTHHIDVTIRRNPPPPRFPDLKISSVTGAVDRPIRAGTLVPLRIAISNAGAKDARNVTFRVWAVPHDGAPIRVASETIDTLHPNDVSTLSADWTPPSPGRYHVVATINDIGSDPSHAQLDIEEADSSNNRGEADVQVAEPLNGTLTATPREFVINQISTTRDETPIVPIVFFQQGSADLDARFGTAISVIAARMGQNPALTLTLRGYVDSLSESGAGARELAIRRARAVYDRFISVAPRLSSYVRVDSSSYAVDAQRGGKVESALRKSDSTFIAQENRRVELVAKFDGVDLIDVAFNGNSADLTPSGRDAVTRIATRANTLFALNPDAVWLISGRRMASESNADLGFSRAVKVRDAVAALLTKPQWAAKLVAISPETTSAEAVVQTEASGEGVLFRPQPGELMTTRMDADLTQKTDVRISSSGTVAVESSRVEIVDADGHVTKTLSAGRGLPENLSWDWHREDGPLVPVDGRYTVHLRATDALGQTLDRTSDTLTIRVTQQREDFEKFILVQFMFNQNASESKLLASRLELAARKVISLADGETRLDVIVSGNTDTVGPMQRNMDLSLSRAQREESHMRQYLKWLLHLDTEEQLSAWLKQRQVTIHSVGNGARMPFTKDTATPSGMTHVLLGDNSLPEGRTLNRRVVIEYRTSKGSGPK